MDCGPRQAKKSLKRKQIDTRRVELHSNGRLHLDLQFPILEVAIQNPNVFLTFAGRKFNQIVSQGLDAGVGIVVGG